MTGIAISVLPVLLLGCAAGAPTLEAYVASQFHPGQPGGVVIVARDGRPILRGAYGLADMTQQIPMTVDQALPIGSVTKSFTAGAILALARDGRLRLHDDVRAHVPNAPVDGRAVTIEQLLTHTAGLPNLVDVPGFDDWARSPRTTSELLAQTRDVPFHFEPGSAFRYSDTGYILLGALLERHIRADWAEAVRKLVAQPLGLASVASAATWSKSDRAATGYIHDDGSVFPAVSFDWSVPHAAGALVATVDDLLVWIRAWHTGAIASADVHQLGWAARALPDGTVSGYAFGWKRCDFEGRTAIQHGGWVPGFTASVLHLPDEGLTAIALLNSEGRIEASYLARGALRLLLTGSPGLAPYSLSAAETARLGGRYRSTRGSFWVVTADKTRIALDLAGRRIQLIPVSADRLCAADSDGTWCFSFEFDDGRRATAVTAALSCEPQARALRAD